MDRHAPESPGEELRFHSAAAAYAALWRGLVFGLGALIVAATVVGQIRAHRFPAWSDLAISAALPFVAYGFLAALTALGCRLLPVRVSADGIRTANYWGVPTFVPWSAIEEADVREVSGIPYVFLKVKGRREPATVPVWLEDPRGFAAAVRRHADPSNPLARLCADAY